MEELCKCRDWVSMVQGGHYVSYVKCKDAWFLCDDSAVFQVDEHTACCPSAYMLFYRQLAIQA